MLLHIAILFGLFIQCHTQPPGFVDPMAAENLLTGLMGGGPPPPGGGIGPGPGPGFGPDPGPGFGPDPGPGFGPDPGFTGPGSGMSTGPGFGPRPRPRQGEFPPGGNFGAGGGGGDFPSGGNFATDAGADSGGGGGGGAGSTITIEFTKPEVERMIAGMQENKRYDFQGKETTDTQNVLTRQQLDQLMAQFEPAAQPITVQLTYTQIQTMTDGMKQGRSYNYQGGPALPGELTLPMDQLVKLQTQLHAPGSLNRSFNPFTISQVQNMLRGMDNGLKYNYRGMVAAMGEPTHTSEYLERLLVKLQTPGAQMSAPFSLPKVQEMIVGMENGERYNYNGLRATPDEPALTMSQLVYLHHELQASPGSEMPVSMYSRPAFTLPDINNMIGGSDMANFYNYAGQPAQVGDPVLTMAQLLLLRQEYEAPGFMADGQPSNARGGPSASTSSDPRTATGAAEPLPDNTINPTADTAPGPVDNVASNIPEPTVLVNAGDPGPQDTGTAGSDTGAVDPNVADPSMTGPDPSMTGPDPSMTGPDPSMTGPDPSMTGPDPSMTGPDPSMTGPDPSMTGPDPSMTGPDPSMTGPDPSMTGPDPSMTGPDPSMTGPDPSMTGPDPSMTGPDPSMTGPDPSMTGPDPSMTGPDPSMTGPDPSMTGPDPSMTGPDPSMTGPDPSMTGPDPSMTGPDPSMTGPDPSMTGPDPSMTGPDPSMTGPDPSMTGPDPSMTGPDPSMTGPDPSMTGPDPSMTGPDPSMTGPDPSMTGSDPSMTGPDPSMTGPDPSMTGPDPSMTGPDPSMTGPDPSMTGPDPSMTGPDPSMTGPDPSMTGPDPSMTGPDPSMTGPDPSMTGPDPSMTGPDPSMTGPDPSMTGPDPSMTGPDPSMTGPDPSMTGPDPSMTGPDPSMTGPDPSMTGPDPSMTGPDPSMTGPDPSMTGPDPSMTGPDPSMTGPDPSMTGPDPSMTGPDASMTGPDPAFVDTGIPPTVDANVGSPVDPGVVDPTVMVPDPSVPSIVVPDMSGGGTDPGPPDVVPPGLDTNMAMKDSVAPKVVDSGIPSGPDNTVSSVVDINPLATGGADPAPPPRGNTGTRNLGGPRNPMFTIDQVQNMINGIRSGLVYSHEGAEVPTTYPLDKRITMVYLERLLQRLQTFARPDWMKARIDPAPCRAYNCNLPQCFVPYDNDCKSYVVCQQTALGTYVAWKMRCAFGSYWGDMWTCVRVEDLVDTGFRCPNDKCRNPAVVTYPDEEEKNCRTYWRCENSISKPACCPPGQMFDRSSLRCVHDPLEKCRSPCPLRIEGCANKAAKTQPFYDGNCRTYWDCANGKPHPVCCRGGASYDTFSGDCVKDSTCADACPIQYSGTEHACRKLTGGTTLVSAYDLDDGNCRTFMRCYDGSEYGEPSCCRPGFFYNIDTARCEELTDPLDPCNDAGCPRYKQDCPFKAHPTDPHSFVSKSTEMPQKCANGTSFDDYICGCENTVGRVPVNTCKKGVHTRFDDPENLYNVHNYGDGWVSIYGKMLKNLTTKGRHYGAFDGANGMEVWRYDHNAFPQVTLKIVFQPNSVQIPGMDRQTMVSNCNSVDGVGPSFEVTVVLSKSQIVFRGQTAGGTAELAVTYNHTAWNTYQLLFDGQTVIALIEDPLTGKSDSSSTQLNGEILAGIGSLKVGPCIGMKNGFVGYVSEVIFSKCLDKENQRQVRQVMRNQSMP